MKVADAKRDRKTLAPLQSPFVQKGHSLFVEAHLQSCSVAYASVQHQYPKRPKIVFICNWFLKKLIFINLQRLTFNNSLSVSSTNTTSEGESTRKIWLWLWDPYFRYGSFNKIEIKWMCNLFAVPTFTIIIEPGASHLASQISERKLYSTIISTLPQRSLEETNGYFLYDRICRYFYKKHYLHRRCGAHKSHCFGESAAHKKSLLVHFRHFHFVQKNGAKFRKRLHATVPFS